MSDEENDEYPALDETAQDDKINTLSPVAADAKTNVVAGDSFTKFEEEPRTEEQRAGKEEEEDEETRHKRENVRRKVHDIFSSFFQK